MKSISMDDVTIIEGEDSNGMIRLYLPDGYSFYEFCCVESALAYKHFQMFVGCDCRNANRTISTIYPAPTKLAADNMRLAGVHR